MVTKKDNLGLEIVREANKKKPVSVNVRMKESLRIRET